MQPLFLSAFFHFSGRVAAAGRRREGAEVRRDAPGDREWGSGTGCCRKTGPAAPEVGAAGDGRGEELDDRRVLLLGHTSVAAGNCHGHVPPRESGGTRVNLNRRMKRAFESKGPPTFPWCQRVGGLFRYGRWWLPELRFSLPQARPVPVKSWSRRSWFGQWSPDPASSATAGLPVPTVGASPGDPRRTKPIRNDSSRDQRAVKTDFAACQHDSGGVPRIGRLEATLSRAELHVSQGFGVEAFDRSRL